MELIYEGTDITGSVDIRECVYRDTALGRSDALELELEHPEAWYGWGSQTDDRLRVRHGGLDTGTLYLRAILPENGRYRIWAAGVPAAAQRKVWRAYEQMTIGQILRACAAECGMDAALYGVDGSLAIPFLLRKNEGSAALLNRLLRWEGAALKAYNGRYIGIGISYAQGLTAAETLRLRVGQRGVEHVRKNGARYAGMTVKTPYAEASAEDADTKGGDRPAFTGLPAADVLTAGRWARGLLLQNNRAAETLRIAGMDLRPKLTALSRVDVDGNADLSGQWIADEVEHDLKNEKTTVSLLRCITSIS